MSIGPPARGWRFTFWNHRIRLAVAPVLILLFAVLFANVVELPGTEPWLRQGGRGQPAGCRSDSIVGEHDRDWPCWPRSLPTEDLYVGRLLGWDYLTAK